MTLAVRRAGLSPGAVFGYALARAAGIMMQDDDSILLLTPGPLTTSAGVRGAMQQDWASRGGDFAALTARVRKRIAQLAGAGRSHVCVPIQGSGTTALEATIATLVPRTGCVLVLINGSYGHRLHAICRRLARPAMTLEWPENTVPVARQVAAFLDAHGEISHVAVVHCETTTGILNPLDKIAAVVAAAGRRLIVDAMSSFGALELDVSGLPCEAAVSSANKCLEGVPGVAFAVMSRKSLAAASGNAPSLTLDLHDQWRAFEKNGQWRFTPPTQVVAALDQALKEHAREGGIAARRARYAKNCRTLVRGMKALGFEPYLPARIQAPIIVTFRQPANRRFRFERFYDLLAERGIVIYPGKLTKADSFRIGCIGAIDSGDIRRALGVIADVLDDMKVKLAGPAP